MVDINAKTWEGETALFLATKNLPFTTQAVHTLLKLRANVNIATNEACSALQYAAVKNDPTVTNQPGASKVKTQLMSFNRPLIGQVAGEERGQSEPFKHLGGDGLTYCHEVNRSKHFKVPEFKFVFHHRKFTDFFPKLF